MNMSGADAEPLTVLKLVHKQSQEKQNMFPVTHRIYQKKMLKISLGSLLILALSL